MLRTYAELVRLPNVFTASADAVAGFLFVGGVLREWPPLVNLAVASACLYAGGVALNDVCDAPRDAVDRPSRPIPSGRISRRHGAVAAIGLLALGLLLALITGTTSFIVAALLVAAISLYNALLKATPVAPLLMGACRSFNLVLGTTATPPFDFHQAFIPAALLGLYVASVTHFAKGEAEAGKRPRLIRGTVGASLAVAGLAILPWVQGEVCWAFLAPTAAMFVTVVVCGRAAWTDLGPVTVQRTVGIFIVLIVVFDTCLVWASRGPVPAMGVAIMVVPVLLFRRTIAMS